MNTIVRLARTDEYEAVKKFYYELIDKMQNMPYHPKWQKGIYPEDKYIKSSVEKQQMYITEIEEKIIGAMIINSNTTDGYEKAKWNIKASGKEIAVIHALGVMPEFSKQGVGKYMVHKAVEVAKKNGQKVIRLDVLDGNLPAEKLYRSAGFKFIETVELFYEDTGLCKFDLYEYGI